MQGKQSIRTRARSAAVLVALGAVMALAAPAVQAELRYRVQDLGLLQGGNEDMQARALNNLGTVVGHSVNNDQFLSRNAAYIWERGRIRALGTFGQWMPYYGVEDVNDAGTAVGSLTDQPSRSITPVMYRDGRVIDLTLPLSGGREGVALGVNNAGVAVGTQNGRAFIHDGTAGQFLPVEKPRHFVRGLDINNSGVVLGKVEGNDGYAFLWNGTKVTQLPNFAGGYYLDPVALNDSGVVVGTLSRLVSGVGTVSQAYFYADGRYQALGRAGSGLDYLKPYAMNDRNWVVGASRLGLDVDSYAFLWRNGQEADLNDLVLPDASGRRWQIDAALDINDRGQIVGTARLKGSDRRHAFLATPVPEAGTWATLLIGLGVVGWRLRASPCAREPGMDRPACA